MDYFKKQEPERDSTTYLANGLCCDRCQRNPRGAVHEVPGTSMVLCGPCSEWATRASKGARDGWPARWGSLSRKAA